MECSSGGFTNYYYGNPVEHITLSDEDPDYEPWDSVEEVLIEHGFDINTPMYNIMGVQVDANYKGIVIQNGKKLLLQ